MAGTVNSREGYESIPAPDDRTTAPDLSQDDAYIALQPLLQRQHPSVRSVYSMDEVELKKEHTDCFKFGKGVCVLPLVATCGLAAACMGKVAPVLIPKGELGLSMNNGWPEFLPSGWHWLLSPFRSLKATVSLTDRVILHETRGIVTIPPGYIGYIEDGGTPVLLGPGIHQWDSDTIRWIGLWDISQRQVDIGPYTLLTVPEGECAVTMNNGVLKILGGDTQSRGEPRTYLLDHTKWKFTAWLSTTEQFDPLKSCALLTNDRVEVDLESTVAWRIVDPVRAAKQGGGMDKIRNLVYREARATVADMILSTKISSGIKGPDSKAKASSAAAVGSNQADNAIPSAEDILEGGGVSASAVDACSHRLERIGVQVDTINIVQFDIRDRNVRDRLSQAAVISTNVQEKSAVAKTEARNMEVTAAAEAETTRLKAQAKADAVTMMAEAKARAMQMHAEAATVAGTEIAGSKVATTLETIRTAGDALEGARKTVFLPDGNTNMGPLMANPNVIST
eukprot:TRINITY_DN67209_c5_g6_i1.p1 TRINITY_DN67209_c5_g6~~TRINITY_DN67209_c5_g6_i1.p1  ORF type:complete len:520 (+),score=50.10 TRINITY_DN67209_c5_g6_i1:39-1562(+)